MKLLSQLTEENLRDKKVLLRVDFNEPIENGVIQDDFKIRSNLETINHLHSHGARVLLVTHHSDKEQSFQDVVDQITTILNQNIEFVSQIRDWNGQSLALLENVRQFPGEDENSEEFARTLSAGFDLYVNDAFSESHRARVSVSAITKFLPSYAGLLLEKETSILSGAVQAPKEGKVVVMGGAKISTKLPVIQNFLDKAEKILIGGALANNFFKAKGLEVGKSLVDETPAPADLDENIVLLPQDVLISKDKTGATGSRSTPVGNIGSDELILDIGPQTAELFSEIIQQSKIVIWNGPMGLSEVEAFAKGTELVASAMASASHSIVGGGDSIAALNKFKLLDRMGFISTGGGAMLSFLSGDKLPGLEVLGYYE